MSGVADVLEPVENRSGSTVEGPLQAVQSLVAHDDADRAVQLYEELGAAQRERLLREAAQGSVGDRRRLVDVLRRAHDFSGAARLLDGSGDDATIADLYAQGGQYVAAAEAYLRNGDVERAAAAFERAGALERALEVYRGLGVRDSMAQCLVRLGRPFEAAAIYRELGQAHAEVEALGGVRSDDARFVEGVLRICKLLDAEGFTHRALAVLADALSNSEVARADPALMTEKARLLRRMGMDAEAEAVLARLNAGTAVPAGNGYRYLKAIPIFGDLSLEDMKDLYRLARQVVIAPGAVLLEKGAAGVGLFVLMEGTVEVFSGPEADARHLNTLGPGAHLGEISLVQEGPVSAHVRARTSVRALRITRAGFQHYLDTHDAAALRIYKLFTHTLASRVRALSS
ncbi:cyclic nucleotide-binding domain-containing protein [Corallococcus sp. H22C18031201]|uniref:cyclic nucleotide-binding domain-containing protein n=1 Tax=Citreicoccus inhibens TaxID=2849499 RepID=UPI000E7322A9|nr:cyclic nucleotide-binding domain-containing protein [Citreicoccus inhibens]MBU8897817.1 cyclic nucleotide-binding domain-containing protein [Citreicoccus inhibens]RJS24917.1 cyclic nucleotide-binding domain-containing protein [Corallococcus sp. H22C18031201]